MNILVVAPMVPRREAPGAIPVLLDAMLEGLRHRHQLSLVCIAETPESDHDAIIQLQESGIDVHAVVSEHSSTRNRWGRRRRMASWWLTGAMPLRSAWFWEPGVQQTIDGLCATRSFDVVTLEDNATGLYTVPGRVPVVLTEYEVRRPRPIDWQSALHGRSRQRWLLRELDWQRWRGYQQRVWRRANLVQVLTARDAAAVASIAPDLAQHVRVNPFGVRLPDRPADSSSEDPHLLLFVGNFSHPPNVDAALWLNNEIVPRVRAKQPSVRLALVGPSPPIEICALADNGVVVTGAVPAIEPFFERAAVVLAPVRTGGGQRMKVLQGMAYGKAVLTTSRGAEGLAIGAVRPPLAIADSAEALAEAAAELLANPRKRHALGRDARAYVEAHYGPTQYAARLERVYGELVG